MNYELVAIERLNNRRAFAVLALGKKCIYVYSMHINNMI
jgi:hypothetical protein